MLTKKLLRSVNRPILVRVLTHTGPQYWAKELTSKCYRHSTELYYTSRFADLFFSLLLTNECRIQKCVDKLYFMFNYSTTAVCLFPSNREVWNSIAHDILNQDIVNDKMVELQLKAAAAGEFTVVSHDETFKSLFNLIGQTKMSQNQGELHALHTFRGFTGCTLGMSAQRSVSQECFMNAVRDTFDIELASKVRFLFSDAPDRIVKAAEKVFDSLLAVGEDPLHLVFRLEHCWGGKRLLPSQRVLELHRKFREPCHSSAPFYKHGTLTLDSARWPSFPILESRTPTQWLDFCALPFNEDDGYESYVFELATISTTYADWMGYKNSKGVTALKILQNAATRVHYEYLQNSSRLVALLGENAIRLGVGTTRNEQLHREFNIWMRNIRMSHRTRLLTCIRVFVFLKLITHSSAAYSPTLIQNSQSRLIHSIAGKIQHNGFFPAPDYTFQIENITCGGNINKPTVFLNPDVVNKRLTKRKLQKRQWSIENKVPRITRSNTTNVFRRPRAGTRQHTRKPKK